MSSLFDVRLFMCIVVVVVVDVVVAAAAAAVVVNLCDNDSFGDHRMINPLIATLKPQSNEPSYSNTVIGRLAVDGWAVTFGTARRGLGGAVARPGPSSLYQM